MYMVSINRNVKISGKWHGYTGTCNYIGGCRIIHLKIKSESDILLINFYLAFLPNPLLLSVRRQCPEACVLYTRRLFAQGDSSSNPAHPFSTPIKQPTLGIQVLGK
jgi:hypothetical protein